MPTTLLAGSIRAIVGHACADELVRVLGLKTLQVGDYVNAVDTSVGPEVEEHDLPFERIKCDRGASVNPLESVRKLWCGRGAGE